MQVTSITFSVMMHTSAPLMIHYVKKCCGELCTITASAWGNKHLLSWGHHRRKWNAIGPIIKIYDYWNIIHIPHLRSIWVEGHQNGPVYMDNIVGIIRNINFFDKWHSGNCPTRCDFTEVPNAHGSCPVKESHEQLSFKGGSNWSRVLVRQTHLMMMTWYATETPSEGPFVKGIHQSLVENVKSSAPVPHDVYVVCICSNWSTVVLYACRGPWPKSDE